MGIRKSDDHTHEIQRLRTELENVEHELKQLHESRNKLHLSERQNERLVSSLQEAKTHIEALRKEVDKLTAPPSTFAVFYSANPDGTVNVSLGGRKLRVNLHPSISPASLHRGQEVILNEGLNVIEARGYDPQGEIAHLKQLMENGRAIISLHMDDERVVELSDSLDPETLSVGDHLLFEARSGCVIEKLPKTDMEELVIEEVPDITYEQIGGLSKELEQVKDAVELPFLYPELFAEHRLSPPKGVLLYGPPGCGKTLIAKAVANSIAKKLAHLKGKEVRSYFLHVKGPELLNKYVGESERQIREVFAKAKEKASHGNPVIVFFDEMDALFRTRGTGISSDIESTIVPQFLAEIDGVESLRDVIVIGASNRQDLIDPAVLRPGRLDIKIKIPRPDKQNAKEILTKYLSADLPLAESGLAPLHQNRIAYCQQLIEATVESMYAKTEENQFLEVTYANGEKETVYFKDFASGALIEGIVSRAKKLSIKRSIAGGEKGLKEEDFLKAIREEFKEQEDLPNTTHPDDWAKIAGKKGEKIVHVRTLTDEESESREIETMSVGHYF
ncbi:MAG: proteasome ATPase [Nitrospira sp.]|nr:proteasome ATPase [Nitrospira sp.]MCB9710759.1 proteasome ATPase [Nitrospiraceae bacterium]MDR4487778.1 proteasome ATPase [Nitrospirales bacterium]MCA9466130.1 proteasome ATPase [Nitrospira sp.]MCA9474449.1 proteasome ATPase [Nitrospira sp.]